MAALFGSEGDAQIAYVSRAELVDTLAARGMTPAPSDTAMSSVAITCEPPGSGVQVRTAHIAHVTADTYRQLLIAAGVQDASVIVAAPSDTSVSGETALLGALKAASTCTQTPLDNTALLDAVISP